MLFLYVFNLCNVSLLIRAPDRICVFVVGLVVVVVVVVVLSSRVVVVVMHNAIGYIT